MCDPTTVRKCDVSGARTKLAPFARSQTALGSSDGRHEWCFAATLKPAVLQRYGSPLQRYFEAGLLASPIIGQFFICPAMFCIISPCPIILPRI